MRFKEVQLSCKCKIDDTYYIEAIAYNMDKSTDHITTEFLFCEEGTGKKEFLILPMYEKNVLIDEGYRTLAETCDLIMDEEFFWEEIVPDFFTDEESCRNFISKYKPKILNNHFG